MTTYIQRITDIVNSSSHDDFYKTVEFLITYQREVIVYGASPLGLSVQELLCDHGVKVRAFFDINAELIGDITSIPVYRPDCNLFTDEEKNDLWVIIATNYKYHCDILRRLLSLGFKNVKIIKSLYYSAKLSSDMRLNSISDKKNDFIDCAKLYQDEESMRLYSNLLKTYTTAEINAAIDIKYEQYFPKDIPFAKDYSSFVDCGAFDGDTLLRLYENYGMVENVIAFEPDERNFKNMVENLKFGPIIAQNIFLYPCAVWSGFNQVHFNSGQGASSNIVDFGKNIVQCIAIDDVFINFKPTFIKMDIEGAEYNALLGAKSIIQKYKPDLAVCVYHSIMDFIKIPKLINGWNLGYKFYLRSHVDYCQEIVLYAVCEK